MVPKVGVEPGTPGPISSNSNDLDDPAPSGKSRRSVAKSANPGDFGQLRTKEKDDSAARSDLGGVTETALADALTQAAGAGQWATVEAIAAELRARREARERNGPGDVARIEPARSKRTGGGR
jgi:hypothetical protein